MIGAGNDKQFKMLADILASSSATSLAADSRFASNALRVQHREELVGLISDALMRERRAVWLERFEGKG